MDAGQDGVLLGAFPPPPAAAPAPAVASNALAIVPTAPAAGGRHERAITLTTTREIDSLHGDEISRSLAEFGKAAPTGRYSKPRGK
jgi:hypothetical protein